MTAEIIRLLAKIDRENDKALRSIVEARKLLQMPAPNTFLSRRSQEPFPAEPISKEPDL
jgi:hypothetical protein